MRRGMTSALTVIATLAVAASIQPVSAQLPSEPTPQQTGAENNLKPGANSFAESQVRDLLEQQGFSNVSPLVNDKNGIWHGTAVKNSKALDVSIDYQGRIATH